MGEWASYTNLALPASFLRAIIHNLSVGFALVDVIFKDCYYRFVKKPYKLFQPPARVLQEITRWLIPGLGVKRWLVLVLTGLTMLSIGVAMFFLDIYRTAPETWWLPILSYISLRFLDRTVRVIIFGGIGLGMIGWGIWGLNRSLLIPFLRPGRSLVTQISDYRKRDRGPRIVAVGGGHGQATLLRGLKNFTNNLTAIVSVADDGGSSGELRRTLGILPPGDLRNCLAALSDDEAMLTQLFQYRFSDDSGLSGHSFGNLFISAMVDITGGFEKAIAESGRVLGVHGRVIPSTLHDVRLVADVQLLNVVSEVRVEGESSIPRMPGRVRRVWLEPTDPPAFPPVIQAILSADMIVIGPGSLYTSILPNLLVPDLLAAIRASRALKAYVVNIATQPGETKGFNVSDHVHAIEAHAGEGLLDLVVCNDHFSSALPASSEWVALDENIDNYAIYHSDLADLDHPWRHDSDKLAKALIDLLLERTGPLVE
jgi:uncharacterized cofD-like protein